MRNRVLIALALASMLMLGVRVAPAATINDADYTTQIQAADVLSRYLTDLNNRADARYQAMTAFLREVGASREYTQQKKPLEHPTTDEYERAVRGAIEFVKSGGGDKLADPELPKLETSKLVAELRVLQDYAAQQFLAADAQQKTLRSMSEFLDATKRTQAYRDWAAKKKLDQAPAELAELPPTAPADPSVFAKAMAARIKLAHDEEWKTAEANGQTAAQFNQQWDRRQQQLKRLIGYRLAALRNGGTLPASPGSPGSPPSPGAVASANPLTLGTPPQAANPSPSRDPRWDPYYYGPTDAWNWQRSDGGDAFNFRSGSGTYRRYDQRLNHAFDLRLDGTYDQRVNIDTDRRLNIHEDPREGI
jgi:hypothetical protein